MLRKLKDKIILYFLSRYANKYGYISKRELEHIIKDAWFGGARHLSNDDGRYSLINIYKKNKLL